MEMLLTNARLILENGTTDGSVLVKDGRIAGTFATTESPAGMTQDHTIDLGGRYLAPGLIDIHIHGSHGIDVIDADAGDLQRLAELLLAEGVTGYVPTLVPIPEETYHKCLRAIASSREHDHKRGHTYSQILGVHFEGPFVSEKKCGALHKELFRTYNGDPATLDLFFARNLDGPAQNGDAACRLMTLAPEVAGGIDLTRHLTRAGLCCFIGHTVAGTEILNAALQAGAVHITHFPNALQPLHHRNPGAVAWGLITDEVSLDSIADFHHVHPDMLRLIYRMKGPQRMALISDAIPPTRLPEGEYIIWGDRIEIKNGQTRLVGSAEGTIAGSVITLLDGVRNMVKMGIPIHESILMASFVPAHAAGLDRRIGSIKEGKLANLVVFDDDLNVQLALIEGEVRLDRR